MFANLRGTGEEEKGGVSPPVNLYPLRTDWVLYKNIPVRWEMGTLHSVTGTMGLKFGGQTRDVITPRILCTVAVTNSCC